MLCEKSRECSGEHSECRMKSGNRLDTTGNGMRRMEAVGDSTVNSAWIQRLVCVGQNSIGDLAQSEEYGEREGEHREA